MKAKPDYISVNHNRHGWCVIAMPFTVVRGVKKAEAEALAAALNEQERRKDQ